LRSSTRNPKRPSSKAHTRCTPFSANVVPKPGAKGLRRGIGEGMTPSARLELDLVLAQLGPDPVEAGIDDAVPLGLVGLGVLEGGNLSPALITTAKSASASGMRREVFPG
jgi:hypothetical protein